MEWLESITQVATISEVIKDVLFQKDNSDRLSRLKQHCSRYSKAAGEYEHLTLKNVHDTITSLVKQREHNLAEKRNMDRMRCMHRMDWKRNAFRSEREVWMGKSVF